MPLVEDARALLEIDRERLGLAERAQEVNAAALETAKELVRIGDQERPKAEAFIAKATEAAGAPAAVRGTGGGGGGGDGRGTGAGGGSAGGRLGRVDVSSQGGEIRTRQWLNDNCPIRPLELPNPFQHGETVTIDCWDCRVRLANDKAIFPVPESMAQIFPEGRSSSPSGGGGTTFSGNPIGRQAQGRANVLGPTGAPLNPFGSSTGGSSVAAPPAPTPGEKLIERAVTSGLREVVKELRATGDLGLQIRRNGGL